jgi:hypothetical protein
MQPVSILGSIKRSLGAIFLIVLSMVVGYFLLMFFNMLFPSTTLSGREAIYPLLLVMSFVIFLSGLWWTHKYGLEFKTTLITLILLEISIYIPLCYFIGSYSIDKFFLSWFSEINFYITLPWIIASVAGFLLNKNRVS